MLCCHIIDLVFVGNSSYSAMSHITPNPSIYSAPSSVFQEASNLTFSAQVFKTTAKMFRGVRFRNQVMFSRINNEVLASS